MATLNATVRFESDDVHTRRDSVEVGDVVFSPESVEAAEAMSVAWSGIVEHMRKRYHLPSERPATLEEAEARNRAAGWTKVR